jgi:hypothetical protein
VSGRPILTIRPSSWLSLWFERPNEGDARHQVERGHHQLLFCLGARGHQVVLVEPAVDEGQHVALGVVGVELLDRLLVISGIVVHWIPSLIARRRHSVAVTLFFDVARAAQKLQIGDIVKAPTRQGHDVVVMLSVLQARQSV